MKYIFTILFALGTFLGQAQIYKATMDEHYNLSISKLDHSPISSRNNLTETPQLDGFPMGFRADQGNKNFRNVTLEDINKDGVQDIIFPAANKLVAISKGNQLWELDLIGIGMYPPSIADIDNDGDMEIVQVTGGNGKNGRVYVIDHTGKIVDGFPKNYDDNWILTAASLADLDGDNQMEIIFLERNSPGGLVHIIDHRGDRWSRDWPIRLNGTPAVTPSIADIDNDGQKDIIVCSSKIMYAFDVYGQLKDGWPIEDNNTSFSYQSPILRDLDGDNTLEIIGASHGLSPEYYVLNHDGSPYKFWPNAVPENEWTYNTPSVVKIDDKFEIIMSRPKHRESVGDMLYAWNEEGDLKDGFPIEQFDGTEGIISVANIDEDPEMEIIFGTNNLEANGFGFIHAYNMDGSGKVEGFPLRPKGWTYMNGAAIGDINGDGVMDLSALSYTVNLGESQDSVFLNVYDLKVPYEADKVLWSTYKGGNTRAGAIPEEIVSNLNPSIINGINIQILPNPIQSEGQVLIQLDQETDLLAKLYATNGQFIANLFDKQFVTGMHYIDIPELASGIYFLSVTDDQNGEMIKKIIVQQK